MLEIFTRRGDGHPEPPAMLLPAQKPSIAAQVQTLGQYGLELQDGVTAQAIADDPDAAPYVRMHPYSALLHCMARDTDGNLTHHPRVAHVDLNSIKGPDTYRAIVRDLAEAAGTAHLLTDVECALDGDGRRYSLRFTFDGLSRTLHPKVDYERADPTVMQHLFQTVAGPGQKHAQIRHGSDVTVVYVPSRSADGLRRVLEVWAWSS